MVQWVNTTVAKSGNAHGGRKEQTLTSWPSTCSGAPSSSPSHVHPCPGRTK